MKKPVIGNQWMRLILVATTIAGLVACADCCSAQGTSEYQLENGLKIALLPAPSARKNALVILYDIGHQFDPAGQSGLSHLCEHLYVTAATENCESRDVQTYMSAYPDGWNAQTGDDYTVIATVFAPDRIEDEIADAADRMRQIRVDQADLDRELPRIDVELQNMYEGFPALAIGNHGRHHAKPLPHDGRRGGRIDQLKAVTVEQVQGWLDQYYKPGNATLVLVGAFDEDSIRKTLEEKFGSIQAGKKPASFTDPAVSEKRIVEVDLQAVSAKPVTRVGFTFRAPGVSDPLYAAFLVHTTRMQRSAMQQRGKAQDMPYMFRPLDDPDFFYVSVDVKGSETPEQAIVRMHEMVDKQVNARLKKFHTTSTVANMAVFLGTRDIPNAMLAMNPYAAAFAKGRRQQRQLDSAELKQQFDNLTTEQMQQAARKFFGKGNRITVIGKPR